MELPVTGLLSFYRGKRVLLTGHTGFKGGWLATWLKMLGASVIGFALPPDAEPNLFTAARIDGDMISIFGDIRSQADLASAFSHDPEIVVHMAAQPLVRRSYCQPVETYATNVMGTIHVLEASRHAPSVRSVVIVTSDKCYENRESAEAYRESDPMGGYDPYSSSKGCAELVTAAYRRSFFPQASAAHIASARAGNVIGGGDWSADRLMPDLVRGVASGCPVTIRRPSSVRPWQHVLEPLHGYLMLGQRLWEESKDFAQAWNFGPRPEDAIPAAEVAQRAIALWGRGTLQIAAEASGPHESSQLRLNWDKARAELGWKPVLSLHEALQWTVEWYRAYYENPAQAEGVTQGQIQRYSQMAQA